MDELPNGYHVTEVSGYGVEGTKYYFAKNGSWRMSDIGKRPDVTLYDTREEACAAARKHVAASGDTA